MSLMDTLMGYLVLDASWYLDNMTIHNSVPRVKFNHSMVFYFEDMLDRDFWMYHWLSKWHWSIPISIFYLFFVKALEYFMKDRPAFTLRGFLIVWNSLLAIFSLFGAIRTWEEWIYTLTHLGFYESICHSYIDWGPSPHWYFYFTVSKVIEFGDTVLLALRKRPLSFLHCYHHMSVLVICVQSGSEQVSSGRWFICMNFGAHAVMYTYFALVSCGVKVPKRIAACVTTIQITQLITGVFINCCVAAVKAFTDWECYQSWTNLGICFFVYITYSMLFIQFFQSTYLTKKEKKKIV